MPTAVSNATAKPVSVKLTPALKARLDVIAAANDRSTHSLMQSAIEAYVEQEEEKALLLKEALEACDDYDKTGLHVDGERAKEWLRKMAAGVRAARPEWQK
jgi:predicted transcriptional regulator